MNIVLDITKPLNNQFNGLVGNLISNRFLATRLKNIFDSVVGFPSDFTKLESRLGLRAGEGEFLYNVLGQIVAGLNSINNLYDLDQGR